MAYTILQRTFEYVEDGESYELTLNIEKPQLSSDGHNYDCNFYIQCSAKEDFRARIGGIDSVQALILALDAANSYLKGRKSPYGKGEVKWLGKKELALSRQTWKL